jgi:hypothetical protein
VARSSKRDMDDGMGDSIRNRVMRTWYLPRYCYCYYLPSIGASHPEPRTPLEPLIEPEGGWAIRSGIRAWVRRLDWLFAIVLH